MNTETKKPYTLVQKFGIFTKKQTITDDAVLIEMASDKYNGESKISLETLDASPVEIRSLMVKQKRRTDLRTNLLIVVAVALLIVGIIGMNSQSDTFALLGLVLLLGFLVMIFYAILTMRQSAPMIFYIFRRAELSFYNRNSSEKEEINKFMDALLEAQRKYHFNRLKKYKQIMKPNDYLAQVNALEMAGLLNTDDVQKIKQNL